MLTMMLSRMDPWSVSQAKLISTDVVSILHFQDYIQVSPVYFSVITTRWDSFADRWSIIFFYCAVILFWHPVDGRSFINQ